MYEIVVKLDTGQACIAVTGGGYPPLVVDTFDTVQEAVDAIRVRTDQDRALETIVAES